MSLPPVLPLYEAKLSDDHWSVVCAGREAMNVMDPAITALLEFAQALHVAVPLKSVVVAETATKGVFTYEWQTVDNRVWKQVLNVKDGAEPTMTFDVSSAFKLEEFKPHRSLRDHVVELLHRRAVRAITINRK